MNLIPSLTVLLIFACLVAYHYIVDLRRDLKTTKDDALTAWKLYDAAHRELCALKGKPVPASYFGEKTNDGDEEKSTSAPFVPSGIGPTAINAREMMREQKEAKAEPRFANPTVLTNIDRHPTESQVSAAARAAAGNGDSIE